MTNYLCAVVEEEGRFIVTYPDEVLEAGTFYRERRVPVQLSEGRYISHPYFLVGGNDFLGFDDLKKKVEGEIALIEDKVKLNLKELYAYFKGRKGYNIQELF